MVRETSGDPSFQELFENRLQARKIVKDLMVQRAMRDLSQKEIAEKIGCTQSRISKRCWWHHHGIGRCGLSSGDRPR
jgi:predicted XRE-type DNA-binding protein